MTTSKRQTEMAMQQIITNFIFKDYHFIGMHEKFNNVLVSNHDTPARTLFISGRKSRVLKLPFFI